MAVVNNMKRKYSNTIYYKCNELLREGKSCAEIGRIIGIPRSTIRNWKLGYSKPEKNNQKRFPEAELKTEIMKIISSSSSIPELAKKVGCPYNSALTVVKKCFPSQFEKIKRKAHKMTKRQKEMSSELAYVLGVMFGDGYCSGHASTRLSVIDKDFRDYFSSMVQKWLNIKPGHYEYRRRGRLYYESHINSIDVRNFLFERVSKKRIPDEIMRAESDIIKFMFIRGFFDSEGSAVVSNKTVKAANKNLTILKSIRKMLIDTNFDSEHISINRSRDDVYVLCMYRKNLYFFRERIGFSIKRKMEKLNIVLRAAPGI